MPGNKQVLSKTRRGGLGVDEGWGRLRRPLPFGTTPIRGRLRRPLLEHLSPLSI